tara:strand:+ start:2217 stop:3176 length:960 start_codon:yes stop_codon:yes gene_type:complete
MKIFSYPPGENWIVDRITQEFCFKTKHKNTDLNSCETIMLFAPWCWNRFPRSALEDKNFVVMLHHIVPEKFDINDFNSRDKFVDQYIVPNMYTHDFVSEHTTKPVKKICYWLNPSLWPSIQKEEARNILKNVCLQNKDVIQSNTNLDVDLDKHTVIGSFQRDTEGFDLKTPKYAKGPDLFIECMKNVEDKDNLLVLLGGWRRQYIISELEKLNIKYVYLDRPPTKLINVMYDCLDLYVVSSRYEGGPQAIIECAYKNIPIISNDVGIAKDILHEDCVLDVKNNFFIPNDSYVKYAHAKCLEVLLDKQVEKVDQLIDQYN